MSSCEIVVCRLSFVLHAFFNSTIVLNSSLPSTSYNKNTHFAQSTSSLTAAPAPLPAVPRRGTTGDSNVIVVDSGEDGEQSI